MRHRCHAVPGRFAAIASTRPRWASEVTSSTPDRPRATRSAKNPFQACPVSLVTTFSPRTSRWPSVYTPVATSTTALTTRPFSRTFPLVRQGIVNASAATKLNGPVSASGRLRNAVTCSSRSASIRETCDFDKLVMPRVCTSLSTRRVETPSR